MHAVTQVGDRAGAVACYIPPLVVEQLPFGVTATEFVAKREQPGADGPSGSHTPQPLSALEGALLSDATSCQVAVVAGEGGSGKSTLLLRLGARLAGEGRAHLLRPAAQAQPPPWTPVLLELREYTAATLRGTLINLVERVCGRDALAAVAGQGGNPTAAGCTVGGVSTGVGAGAAAVAGAGAGAQMSGTVQEPPRVRLLVLCDGADEMQDARPGALAVTLKDLAETLCGATPWSPAVLRIVVTTRGEVAPGVGLLRRVLLPFGRPQVCY